MIRRKIGILTRHRCSVIRKGFAQLLNGLRAAPMFCHIAIQDSPPVMLDDEEAVEHAEGERRHSEEIHCCNRFAMIAQKRCPSLCRLGIL